MYAAETVHRYPRLMAWSIEALCTLLVTLGMLNLGFTLLRAAWSIAGLDRALFARLPWLAQIVAWVETPSARNRVDELADLLPTLGWLALALFVVVMLRSAFPVVRTGSRGLLVEFGGSWLPVPWQTLRALKVTEDLAAERFVLLVQTDGKQLTGWHRFYSLLYNLRWQRGFLVTSSISEFDQLVQTILTESGHSAQVSDTKAISLEEHAQSPLFRFLLGPASFFSRRTLSETAAPAAPAQPVAYSGPLQGTYPLRITAFFTWSSIALAVLVLWHYLNAWVKFLALMIPAVRQIAPFSWVFSDPEYVQLANAYRSSNVPFFGVPDAPYLPAPWWILVSAHLVVLLMIGILLVVRNLLPSLESRAEGLAVRDMLSGRWQLVPWKQIVAVKATEFSEQSQLLLLQTRSGVLPGHRRVGSLIYDGGFKPGVLVTSAMSNFHALMHDALSHVTSQQSNAAQQPDAPLLQQEAPSWLLWLAFKPGAALDQLVSDAHNDDRTRTVQPGTLFSAAQPIIWLALLPALFVLVNAGLLSGSPPGLRLLIGALFVWLVGVLEWPLVSLLSVVLDEATGGGDEGYRALYLYPVSQLPRLLPLLGTLVLLLLNVPLFWLVTWIGASVWSFVLAGALWEKLYGWKGSQTLLGGVIPVIWQLLVMLVYILVQR